MCYIIIFDNKVELGRPDTPEHQRLGGNLGWTDGQTLKPFFIKGTKLLIGNTTIELFILLALCDC